MGLVPGSVASKLLCGSRSESLQICVTHEWSLGAVNKWHHTNSKIFWPTSPICHTKMPVLLRPSYIVSQKCVPTVVWRHLWMFPLGKSIQDYYFDAVVIFNKTFKLPKFNFKSSLNISANLDIFISCQILIFKSLFIQYIVD